jgi:hypothetical protein
VQEKSEALIKIKKIHTTSDQLIIPFKPQNVDQRVKTEELKL